MTKELRQKKLKDYGSQFIFMPDATRGAVRTLTTEQIKSTGTKALVVNTLHLLIFPGPDLIQELGGIHKFMDWDGVVLTDSGGFQIFSLLHLNKWEGEINKDGAIFKSPRDGTEYTLTPESSIDIQMKIDSDVLTCLDDCLEGTTTREKAEVSVERTVEWAKRCRVHFDEVYGGTEKTGKVLGSVVQGANYPDLRKKGAEELMKIGFDGYNFGGYVINDEGELVEEEMKIVFDETKDAKFNYAMGVGKPEDILAAAKIGYKVFDTVLPTRNARHGTLYTTDSENGLLKLNNSEFKDDLSPIDSSCPCEACKSSSRAYVHNMLKIGESTGMTLATIHNLTFYQRLIDVLNKNQSSLEELTFQGLLQEMAKG